MATESAMALSSEQKAAMIADLNNELTTRTEKLQLMYKTQVDTLRSRLERRVNRIPNTWRERNIMDLVEKYAEDPKKPTTTAAERKAQRPIAPSRQKAAAQTTKAASQTAKAASQTAKAAPTTAPAKGVKRPSTEIASDKENRQAEQLAVPKKRAKVAATRAPAAPRANQTAANQPAAKPSGRTTRAASRKQAPPAAPEVLSPKTNNSKTVAQPRTRRQR